MTAFRPDGFDAFVGDAIAERDDGEIERRRDARHDAANDRHAKLERIYGIRLETESRTQHGGTDRGVGIGHVDANI